MNHEIFTGIDVAFAKDEKLPICIATNEGDGLVPLDLNNPNLPPIPRGISCFATPTRAGFDEIRRKAARHLEEGGAVNRLPHANQLWGWSGLPCLMF